MGKKHVIAGAALALVVGSATGVLVSRAVLPHGPVPPPSAPVAEVARAYLAAAKAHDCGLTRALTASDGTWAWCSNPRLLAYRHVGRPSAGGENSTPVPETCVAFTMTTAGSSDGSIQVGDEPWSLCFVHTAHGWRLYDQGQG